MKQNPLVLLLKVFLWRATYREVRLKHHCVQSVLHELLVDGHKLSNKSL